MAFSAQKNKPTFVGRRLPRQFYLNNAGHLLPRQSAYAGFTLIEIIIGIVALSISMAIIFTLIVPVEQQSADQVHQIKAAELGQSMLDEILARAYDQNSDMSGGVWRCNETGRPACTPAVNFGADAGETDRSLYNDVDDYQGFNQLVNATNNNLDAGYNSFQLAVAVSYDGVTLGLTNNLAKRITVTITTPLGTAIEFTGYKSNF